MRKAFVLAVTALLMFAFAGVAQADKPSQTGNGNRPCINAELHNFTHPLCDEEGNFLPPGLGGANPGCDNAAEGRNPNCPPEEPEEPEEPTCPPADGPVSGVVQQISDGIRGGGGGALADVVDQVNCALIVGVLGL